ncbi:MAG: response regulator transcription factor [Ignavibacteriales bacterium]|nr:response regulator transcription factor [Ignavibacteriales bacterium]
MPVRVAIVEDHDDFREGLSHLLENTEGFRCVASFSSVEETLRKFQSADVVLMDIGLPGKSGIEGAQLLREKSPKTQIIMLTVFEDDKHIFEAIRSGANGYILKKTPPTKILEAVEQAASGGMPMTPFVARQVVEMFRRNIPEKSEDVSLTAREKEILALLVDGLNYSMIGERLFISLDTVRNHIRHIYEKLHVHSKSQAVARAIKEGLTT